MTPLKACLEKEQFELAQKLLKRGASVDIVDSHGKTYLVQCLEAGNYNAVGFLLHNNANPHIEDNQGHDACDYASLRGVTTFSQLNLCEKDLRIKFNMSPLT